jgi:hypothetical protein
MMISRGCADRKAHRGLGAAVDGAGEQQICHVGASDQEHRAAHREQNLQTAPVFLFHHGNARAGGNHADVLLGQQAFYIGHERRRIA